MNLSWQMHSVSMCTKYLIKTSHFILISTCHEVYSLIIKNCLLILVGELNLSLKEANLPLFSFNYTSGSCIRINQLKCCGSLHTGLSVWRIIESHKADDMNVWESQRNRSNVCTHHNEWCLILKYFPVPIAKPLKGTFKSWMEMVVGTSVTGHSSNIRLDKTQEMF